MDIFELLFAVALWLLFAFLGWIDRLPGQVLILAAPSRIQLALALLGALLLTLPRGLAFRWGGLALIAPLLDLGGGETVNALFSLTGRHRTLQPTHPYHEHFVHRRIEDRQKPQAGQ